MPTNTQTQALVVATPGRFRDALRAVVTAMPAIDEVIPVDDVASLPATIVARQPALVLLDASTSDAFDSVLVSQVRRAWPDLPWVVLSETVRQERTARGLGADAVLPRRSATVQLFAIISQLLSQQDGFGRE